MPRGRIRSRVHEYARPSQTAHAAHRRPISFIVDITVRARDVRPGRAPPARCHSSTREASKAAECLLDVAARMRPGRSSSRWQQAPCPDSILRALITRARASQSRHPSSLYVVCSGRTRFTRWHRRSPLLANRPQLLFRLAARRPHELRLTC